MAVVVTGAAGFVGRHLSRRLAALGMTVVGIDRRSGMPGSVIPICADLAAPTPEVLRALRTAEAVWHLAARPGVRDDTGDIETIRYRDNVVATDVVCRVVTPSVPLIFTSSSSIYGGADRLVSVLRPSRESDRPRPLGGYALSKVRAERICQRRMAEGGATCIARPFTIVGEGQRPDMALARWIDAARNGGRVTVFGSPERRRDLTDVRDVVECLIAAADRAIGHTINIGTGHSFSLNEMITTVFEVLGREVEIDVVDADGVEAPATLADVSLLRALLGRVPSTDLHDVIERQASHMSGANVEEPV